MQRGLVEQVGLQSSIAARQVRRCGRRSRSRAADDAVGPRSPSRAAVGEVRAVLARDSGDQRAADDHAPSVADHGLACRLQQVGERVGQRARRLQPVAARSRPASPQSSGDVDRAQARRIADDGDSTVRPRPAAPAGRRAGPPAACHVVVPAGTAGEQRAGRRRRRRARRGGRAAPSRSPTWSSPPPARSSAAICAAHEGRANRRRGPGRCARTGARPRRRGRRAGRLLRRQLGGGLRRGVRRAGRSGATRRRRVAHVAVDLARGDHQQPRAGAARRTASARLTVPMRSPPRSSPDRPSSR